MSVNKSVKTLNTDSYEFNTSQNDVITKLNQLSGVSILNGRLQSASLASGANRVEHRLGRRIKGYIVVSSSVAVTLSDNIGTNASDLDTAFTLNSSGASTVLLWVF